MNQEERHLIEAMQEVFHLLHVLIAQGEQQARQLDRLIELLEKPKTFPQATSVGVSTDPL